jgi:hypothetical protein
VDLERSLLLHKLSLLLLSAAHATPLSGLRKPVDAAGAHRHRGGEWGLRVAASAAEAAAEIRAGSPVLTQRVRRTCARGARAA